MVPTEPKIAAVVATHRRRERLPELLDGLLAEPFSEIFVVVNGGDDGSLAVLRERAAQDPRLQPRAVEPASKPAAVRCGVEAAASEVVLILDDDVIPRPGLAAGHARHHAARHGLVVIGYMPVARRSPRRPGEFGTELYQRAYDRVCAEYEADPDSILKGLWGGNVSLRREDVLRVDSDDHDELSHEHLRHEDRDFGLRCAALGLEATFDRALIADHRHRLSRQAFLNNMRTSGRERWTLHHRHAETLGPLPGDFFLRDMPLPERLLLRLSQRRWGYRPVSALLATVATVAGALRLFRIETHAGWLLGTVEQQRGAREAMSEEGLE
jgi:glycosyltransferase involved in cell wall biosynthesis